MDNALVFKIGENAGIVYRFLNAAPNDKFTADQLKKATKLKADELSAALGWLAREDKVRIQEENGKVLYAAIGFYF